MKLLRAVLFLPAALLLNAQGPSSPVTIRTDPAGAEFMVDGVRYRNTATFTWPEGSKHTLAFPYHYEKDYQIGLDPDTRYQFGSWVDSSGQMNAARDVTVTASSRITSYTAQLSKTFAVRLEFSELRTLQPEQSPVCAFPGPAMTIPNISGVVRINGVCYWADTTMWLSAGGIALEAYPYPGFVFAGWGPAAADPFLTQVELTGPIILRARFIPGKRVRFFTNPIGLDVTVDRPTIHTPSEQPCPSEEMLTPVIAPAGVAPLCRGEFDFAPGSKHVFGAVSPQRDMEGRDWVFWGWGDTTAKTIEYTTGSAANIPETFTARFVRGVAASFITVPTGLKLAIDGRDNWASTNFIWGVGEKHTVKAPAELTDSRGRKYAFSSWSNGGPATQEIAVTSEHVSSGIRLAGTYTLLNQTSIQTSVPGLVIKVDGADCASPCTVHREIGSQVRISVPAVVETSEFTRYEFQGPATEWTVTIEKEYETIVANYRMSNRLLCSTEPGTGAELVAEPGSSDGFYPVNTQVAVSARVKPGFKLLRWEGDLQADGGTAYVHMGGPRFVRAMLTRVPYIAPQGVRNAAGETPETGVAAGSLISIVGQSLAKGYQAGPTNPLAQTLDGVVVRVEDRILPLVFVSTEQINALLPSDVAEGDYSLTVQTTGQPDVSAPFTVVRNAPGLFSAIVDGKTVAVAVHEDGSPVTPTSPARRGEQVRLMGTGVGPFDRRPIDGFPTPAQPLFTVVDTTEVIAGDLRLPVIWTGAAPGLNGVTAVRFRIPAELSSGAAELRVAVNGKLSNSVVLPVE